MQEKSRTISPVVPEHLSSILKDIETEDFPAASSTVIHEESPLDEEYSRTPIPNGVGRGIVGPSKFPNMTEGKVGHSQKSKNAGDDHSEDQLEVSQEKVPPLKMADLEPTTEPEDSAEGEFNSQKKFKPSAAALLPDSSEGTCVASIIVGY